MKIATVREFRDHASKLLASDEPVFITRKGKTAGVYIPIDSEAMPMDLRMELFRALAAQTRAEHDAKGITEEQTLAEFEAARKARR